VEMQSNKNLYTAKERKIVKETARNFEKFENIYYRYDYMKLSESLKFAGVPSKVETYHKQHEHLVQNKFEPYTEIHLWNNMTNKNGDWIYGCLVTSLNNQPEGILGADTGWTRFVVMTIRCDTVEELLKGPAIEWGHHNTCTYLPDVYKEQVTPFAPGATRGYSTIGGTEIGSTSNVEIYPVDIRNGVPEMYFYIPLKAE